MLTIIFFQGWPVCLLIRLTLRNFLAKAKSEKNFSLIHSFSLVISPGFVISYEPCLELHPELLLMEQLTFGSPSSLQPVWQQCVLKKEYAYLTPRREDVLMWLNESLLPRLLDESALLKHTGSVLLGTLRLRQIRDAQGETGCCFLVNLIGAKTFKVGSHWSDQHLLTLCTQ